MKRLILAAVSTAIALVLPGCLQSETTVTLQKDGSGTVVEQTTLGAQMLAMLEQFAGIGGGAAAKDPLDEMFSVDKAKAKASTMGEGVTFEKSEPVTVGGSKGARITYKFTDVNKLKVSPGDGMSDMSPMAGAPGAPPKPEQKPVTFNYAGGKLTVTMPDPEKPAAETPKPEGMPDLASSPEMQAQMKQVMGDMKMSFKLVIEPGIAETDATHRDGKTITLMEMEMGKLFEKPDTFKKLSSVDQSNPAAAMEVFKTIEGVRVETKKSITVTVD